MTGRGKKNQDTAAFKPLSLIINRRAKLDRVLLATTTDPCLHALFCDAFSVLLLILFQKLLIFLPCSSNLPCSQIVRVCQLSAHDCECGTH